MTTTLDNGAAIPVTVDAVTYAGEAPADWPGGSRSWRVTLRRTDNGETMTVDWHTGPGLADPEATTSEAAAVLDCLAADAAMVDNAGPDPDPLAVMAYVVDELGAPVAPSTVRAMIDNRDRFATFLGPVLYDLALWGPRD